MSRCYQCTAKFGFFRKEYDCKGCGKAFCYSCLTYKAVVPKSGNKEQPVCKDCFKKLTQTVSQNEKPPSYNEATAQTRQSSHQRSGIPPKAEAKADPDAELRDRLKNLKGQDGQQGNSSGVSDQDIADRFKDLTGRNAQVMQKSDILTPKPKLTETEEIAQLLERAQAEANLDAQGAEGQSNNTDDLERRLLNLQGIDPEKAKKHNYDAESSEDESEITAKILRKALQEAAIDEKVKESGYGDVIADKGSVTIGASMVLPGIPRHQVGGAAKLSYHDEPDSNDEELPWCCICNADASLRCRGCDDDLYCKRCFKKGHIGEDMDEHKTSPFRKK